VENKHRPLAGKGMQEGDGRVVLIVCVRLYSVLPRSICDKRQ